MGQLTAPRKSYTITIDGEPRVYTLVNRRETNLSANYVPAWGAFEAVRETLQNSVDEAFHGACGTGRPISEFVDLSSTRYDRIVRDFGRGVDLEQILLIGESGKRDEQGTIGEKGEGGLLSFLVLARLDIPEWMFSRDWMFTARIEQIGAYPVVVVYEYKTDRPIVGTACYIDRKPEIEEIFRQARLFFPALFVPADRMVGDGLEAVFDSKADVSRLYNKGFFVTELDSLFSYNLDIVLNRDRTMVDSRELATKVSEALGTTPIRPAMMRTFWQAVKDGRQVVETRYGPAPCAMDSARREAWKAAFYAVFGKRACVQTDDMLSLDAVSADYLPISLSDELADVAMRIGVKTDAQVSSFNGQEFKVGSSTCREQVIVNQCAAIVALMTGQQITAYYVPTGSAKVMKNAGFVYNRTVYVTKSSFERGLDDVLDTVWHETTHIISGLQDWDRQFAIALSSRLISWMMGAELDQVVQVKSAMAALRAA
jgi:hypothetical protein